MYLADSVSWGWTQGDEVAFGKFVHCFKDMTQSTEEGNTRADDSQRGRVGLIMAKPMQPCAFFTNLIFSPNWLGK